MQSINMSDAVKAQKKAEMADGGFEHKGNVPVSTHELVTPQGKEKKPVKENEIALDDVVDETATPKKTRTRRTRAREE